MSIVPPTHNAKPSSNTLTLQAVNGTTIRTYDTCSLTLNLGLQRTFRWIFIVADFANPIIGADFLQHFGLIVDMNRRHLIDSITNLKVQRIQAISTSPSPPSSHKHPLHHLTPFSLNILPSPSHQQTCRQSNTVSLIITFLQLVHLSSSKHDACPRNDSKLPARNSTTCSSLELSVWCDI